MDVEDHTNVWIFHFGLEKAAGGIIERKVANELFKVILTWAEENNCQIGGGYRIPTKDDTLDFS